MTISKAHTGPSGFTSGGNILRVIDLVVKTFLKTSSFKTDLWPDSSQNILDREVFSGGRRPRSPIAGVCGIQVGNMKRLAG